MRDPTQAHREKEFQSLNGINVKYLNTPPSRTMDLYHQIHNLSWTKAFFFFIGLFLSVNSLFATIYWLDPTSLANAKGTWWECFLFSIQKFSDIGYGHITPVDLFSEILSVFHAFIGITSFAIITGYFFAKFSLVKPRIEFTEKATITNFQGQDALVFRFINLRHNNIGDVEITASLFLDVTGPGGQPLKEGFDLQVVRSRFPVIALCINIIHLIDDKSPLRKCISDRKFTRPFLLLVTVNGIDSTFGQFVQTTKVYHPNDIVWGKDFSNVLQTINQDSFVVDFGNFNQFQ